MSSTILDTWPPERRMRILGAARVCYSEAGYSCTTLGGVAVRAGVPVEAIFEEFGGRFDLYVAVLRQVESAFYDRLRTVAAEGEGFVAAAGAMLDEVVRLTSEDTTLAPLLSGAAVDARRDARLRCAVGEPWARQRDLCRAVVQPPMALGELAEGDVEIAASMVSAMIAGLLASTALAPGSQMGAVEGLKHLLARQSVDRGFKPIS